MSTTISSSDYRAERFEVGPVQPPHVMHPLRLRERRRRWRIVSLIVTVLLPTALAAGYLTGYADNQFESEFRFTVRHEVPLQMEPSAASALTAPLSGAPSPLAVITDSQIVIQYLKSRQIITDLAADGVDLDKIYARQDRDFLSHLAPNASIEERQRYWQRMVDPFFDMTTGVISVNVRAFRPADAQFVAAEALHLSERLVNSIANKAHADVLAYATQEVRSSAANLKAAEGAIAAYRNRYAVLFPEMQANADTTLEGRMQEDLITQKTTYQAQIAQGTSKDTAQMRMLASRIAALQTELNGVHGQVAQSGLASSADPSLASVMSEYGVLHLREDIAAKIYERALMSQQDARNAASQQGVYLAAFVRPGLPQTSTYPVRWRVLLETALLSFVGWCLVQLLYHGIRDHIE